MWTLLHHKGVDVVPFLGIFSNEAHPFGIVYDRMGGLDLKQYLGGEPNVGGVKLVLIHIPTNSPPSAPSPSSPTVN